MINKKQPTRFAGDIIFYKDFIQTPSWKTIRFKASFISALFISIGILLPFFLGFFMSLKQEPSQHFIQYYTFVSVMSIIVCLPLSVFFIRFGLLLYSKITKKNLKRYGF